jgi:electron transfer flavoprotein beta subunit
VRIVVLVKEVPDTYGDRKLDLETGLADRAAGDTVLDEICERALEVALSYADRQPGAEIIAISMGPATVPATLRKALAMGATSAVHVVDDALVGADLGTTAEVLAAAITKTGFDVVISGNLSTDGTGGVMAAWIAELLGVPHLTSLASVDIGPSEVRGRRVTELGAADVEAAIPVVISITEALPEARFASFKGIMAAKRKPLESWGVADLGVDLGDEAVSRSIVLKVSERPARASGVKIIDDGDAAKQLADFLVSNRLV